MPGKYKEPKPGIGYLAQRTGATVLPVYLDGARKLYKPWTWPKVRIIIGQPIFIEKNENPTHENNQKVADEIFTVVRTWATKPYSKTMLTFDSNKRDKHRICVGDVFLIIGDRPELFLVETANEFVSAGLYGGVGYEGTIVAQETPSFPGRRHIPVAISFCHTVGRRYMNEQIDAGQATRIAHFADLEWAKAAIENWSSARTDVLAVPVPA